MFLQEIYELVDYILCDDASSNKVSQNYGSNISLRNSGTATLSYDSTNHNYNITVGTTGESFIPITSATGLTDFTVEFDTYINEYNAGKLHGFIIYKDSNNWYRVGYMPSTTSKRSIGNMSGGSWVETPTSITQFSTGKWIHYKATITNNTLKVEFSYNGTTYDSYTVSLSSSLFTSTTKYGIIGLWNSNLVIPFKNIKVKAL